ncbi:regulatory YrvL family protein [Emergencia timonensis]|uniref:regulatory YrvL family protein n=1 Tax=Emergencia timonensis TaxID=1776384 RepID=UPI003993E7D9
MKKKIKERFASAIAYGLLAGLIIGIVAVIAYFGGAVMKVFGFEYESPGSIVLFFLFTAIAGFPAETIAKAFPRALLSLEKITVRGAKVLFVILDTAVTAVSMAIVDYFMDSVTATDASILVISLILALLSREDFDERE